MNTEYVALKDEATVADAIGALRANEELLESLNTIFLTGARDELLGSVPLAKLFVAPDSTPLRTLISDPVIRVTTEEKQNRVTELFDKYNLLTLPVVDSEGRLEGVITADDIISVLREK
jgi:Mg/Co/Ni transporter MgtE